MKYFYLAVQRKVGDKYNAYVLRVSTSKNIANLDDDVQIACIYPTKKEALEVVEEWNEIHKRENRYLF